MILKYIETKYQLLFSILVTSVIAFLLGWLLGGLLTGVILSAICIIILMISKNIWYSDKGNYLIRLAAINVVSIVVGFSNGFIQPVLSNFIKEIKPNWNLPDFNTSPIVYVFLLFLLLIVFYFTQDKTVLGKDSKSIINEIKEPNFKERFVMVCESLADDIRKVDKDTNWSAHYFTPLDAEVEIVDKKNKRKKVVKDLIKAIKETNERLVLVLGDPGGGKSVALRKLCLDLLSSNDILKTYKIPIYINLKEWVSDREWTVETPPSFDEIKEFVLNNLKNRDIVTRDFFEDHFDILYENGNLFFIFDSFDEIPAILGTSHESELIDKVSYAFNRFLKGARQPKAQGILSSREFRKPTDSFSATTTLLIRPFSTKKINSTFNKAGRISDEKIKELFKERPDLVVHARNPFTAALLSNYIIKSQGTFPQNLADIYESFIQETLTRSCKEKLDRYKITADEVLDFMTKLGSILFEQGSLEISVRNIRKQIHHPHFDEIIEILKFSRLCRESQGIERLISFSHRRFCEFFAVKHLIRKDSLDDTIILDIPTDSLWRDTLALYCMVAPYDKSSRIAEFCWETIKSVDTLLDNRAIHSLRFLVDAFSGRRECLDPFKDDLSNFILTNIDQKNIFSTKFAVEALTILDINKIDEGTVKALSLGNNWINETSIRGCRHLESISENLASNLIDSFGTLSVSYFNLREKVLSTDKDELLFSLRLSESFINVLKTVQWMYLKCKISKIFFWTGTLFFTIIPLSILISIGKINLFPPHTIYGIFSVLIIILYSSFIFNVFSPILADSIGFILFFKNKNREKIVKSIGFYFLITLLLGIFFINIFSGQIKLFISAIKKFITFEQILFCFIALYILSNLDLLYSKEARNKLIESLKKLINILLIFSRFIPDFYKCYLAYNKSIIIENPSRKNIYDSFIDVSPFFTSKYLDFLEANIKGTYGEYPKNDLFEVSINKNKDRLAKLEIKWQGLEK